MAAPVHYDTLADTAAKIAAGDLDSSEVTATILNRISQLEPQLHAYITVLEDSALERAASLDAMRDRGESLGRLHGVPVAVKDLCHKAGAPTTGGHSFRRNMISEFDATVVTKLEAAGAVIVGKLATTEGAMVGYHRDFDVPRNPWGTDRWPGVSSGGSGVATAAGLCFGSLGTDTGGSIRFPSAVNGLVGLKPTWGRVSRHGVLDLAPTLDHVGPMTRSVRDAARILSVIAGRDENDPTTLPDTVPDYEAELELGIKGLRIGWDESFATTDVEPFIVEAIQSARHWFEAAGAHIVPVKMPSPDEETVNAWTLIAAAEAAAVHANTFPSRQADYGVFFNEFLLGAQATTGIDLARANFARKGLIGSLAPVFSSIDVLLTPTLAEESPVYDPAGAYGGIDLEAGTWGGVPFAFFGRNTRFIGIWDMNGYPTLSVPCGLSPNDQPMSLQLIAPPLGESLLCRAGFAFEQAHEFYRHHPPV